MKSGPVGSSKCRHSLQHLQSAHGKSEGFQLHLRCQHCFYRFHGSVLVSLDGCCWTVWSAVRSLRDLEILQSLEIICIAQAHPQLSSQGRRGFWGVGNPKSVAVFNQIAKLWQKGAREWWSWTLCEALSVDVVPRRTLSICLNQQKTPIVRSRHVQTKRPLKPKMSNGRLKSLFESTSVELLQSIPFVENSQESTIYIYIYMYIYICIRVCACIFIYNICIYIYIDKYIHR